MSLKAAVAFRSMRTLTAFASLCLGSALLCTSGVAAAFPGFFVGKKETVGTAHATHLAIYRKGDLSVVSVMPDYEGSLEPFAIVMPVPSDVTLEHVKTLKREFLDRIEMLTAPRFMEFWEMDPCDPGPLEQEWERSKMASASTDFLGGGSMLGPTKKVPPEMLVEVKPEFKDGEYTFSLLDKEHAGDLGGLLKGKGYVLPDKDAQAVKPYVDSGMSLLVAEVDTKRIELVEGSGRRSPPSATKPTPRSRKSLQSSAF